MSTSATLDLPEAPAGYRQVLTAPHVLRLLTGAVIGHLPVSMAPVALLLTVRAQGGSVAQASLLAAVFGVSAALGQPLWGRMLDRRGHAPALLIPALAATLAFAALTALDPIGHPTTAAGLTVAAGLATAPLEAALRVLWPEVTDSDGQLRAALGLDACAQEAVFIAGPLLVLALHALGGPSLALAAAAVTGLAGTLAFASAPPVRRWQPGPRRRGDWIGPLRAPGPRALALALLGAGVALGALNVVAVDLAGHHNAPALTTLIPAALAVGSLTGGLLYGRRRWPGSPFAQLLSITSGLLAGLLPFTATPGPDLAVAAAVLPGLFLAPLLVTVFASLDALAPAGTLGEASAWMIACLGLGQAAGTALGGASTDTGPLSPAAVALCGAVLACAVLVSSRSRLTPPPRQPSQREA